MLAPGLEHEIGGCTLTGVFLQKPAAKFGGDCDVAGLCPSGAAACRKDPVAGVLCYGCAVIKEDVAGVSSFACAPLSVIVVQGQPAAYSHPNVTDLELTFSDQKCSKITVSLDRTLLRSANDTGKNGAGARINFAPSGDSRVFVHLPILPLGRHEIVAKTECVYVPTPNAVDSFNLTVISRGYGGSKPDFFRDGVKIMFDSGVIGRGVNVLEFDPHTGNMLSYLNYDTSSQQENADALAGALNMIQEGHIVGIAVHDTARKHMTQEAYAALSLFGRETGKELKFGFRAPYALIGIKGGDANTASEAVSDQEGDEVTVTKTFRPIEIVATSEARRIQWTVIDPRPTNTSITGATTTKNTEIEFELTANKPGCSFDYNLDGDISTSIVTSAAGNSRVAARIESADTSAPWPRTTMNIVFQSSLGAGALFRSTLQRVTKDDESSPEPPVLVLEDVVSESVSRQAQLTLHNLVMGKEYELRVDVQNGQAIMTRTIVVGGSAKYSNDGGGVWKTFLWTKTDPVTASRSNIFEFGCSCQESIDDGVRFVYALDGKPTVSTNQAELILIGVEAGVHRLDVFCEHKNETQGDPLPLSFVWVVLSITKGGDTPLSPHYSHYTRTQSVITTAATLQCPRPTIKVTPLSSSSQQHAVIVLGHTNSTALSTADIPSDCGWRLELDGRTFRSVSSSDPTAVVGPLRPGLHVLRVFSSLVAANGDIMDQSHAPAVVSWTVEKETPWDRTTISFQGLSAGWHEVKAYATDPLNATDVQGANHRFFVDLEPPVSGAWEKAVLDSVGLTVAPGKEVESGENPAVITSNKAWTINVACGDNNKIVPCSSVEWNINRGNKWHTVPVSAVSGKAALPVLLVSEATADDCLSLALASHGKKVISTRPELVRGSWSHRVPSGCSVQSGLDFAAHWNDEDNVVGDPSSYTVVVDDRDGTRVLTVRSIDGVGNVEESTGASARQMTFMLDTTAPSVLVNPAFAVFGSEYYTTVDGGTLLLSVNDTTNTSSTCRHDAINDADGYAGEAVDCTKGTFTTMSSGVDGERRVIMLTTDAAALTTTTVFRFVVDRIPPTIALSSILYLGDVAVEGQRDDLKPSPYLKSTRASSVTLKFAVHDDLSGLHSLSCTLDGAIVACSPENPVVEAKGVTEEGVHTVVVNATDNARLTTTFEWMWRHDVTPPSLVLKDAAPPAKISESMKAPLSASANEEDSVYEYSLLPIDTSETSSCASPVPSWKRDGDGYSLPAILEVSAWGTYELAVRAIDAAGNVPTEHVTRRIVFVPPITLIQLNKPKISGIMQVFVDDAEAASSTAATDDDDDNNGLVLVEWQYEGDPSHPDPSGFEVRIAHDRQFVIYIAIEAQGASSRSIVLPTNTSLWKSELSSYLQVRTYHVNSLTKSRSTSEWSASTDPWTTANKCARAEEYLDVSPLLLSEWKCVRCPYGAWCTGNTVWRDVVPKLGFWRVPWSNNGIQNGTMFVQCPFANDCLGHSEGKGGADGPTGSGDNIRNSTSVALREGCKEGTTGIACSTCAANYNRDGQACVECTEADFTLRLCIVVLVFVLLIGATAMFRKRLKRQWKRFRPLYRDVLRILAINITFAQISASLPTVIEVKWPLAFVEFVDMLSFANIDLMSLIGVNCIGQFDFMLSFTFMSLVPLSIILVASLEYFFVSKTLQRRMSHMSDEKKREVEKETLHLLFKIADTDHSGVIDPSELGAIIRQLGWNVNLRTAIDLAEGVGGKTNERGVVLLDETQFVGGMTSGKMARLLGHKGVQRRGRSIMMRKNSKQKTMEMAAQKTTQKASTAAGVPGSLGSRNKLVQWTLRRLAVSQALSGATQLLLLAHTPVSRKVFQFFHFDTVGGRKFLRADYSVELWSANYTSFLPVVLTVLFVYTLALPGVISYYLFRHRKELYSTAVYQTIGWLYDAFVRGAEFWQVHDVLLKMTLTGLLIFVPNSSRAAIGALLCMIACCNLNYHRPHKNKLLFWLTQISFLVTAFKYLSAMILTGHRADMAKAVEIGVEIDDRMGDLIARLLITLDILFLVYSLLTIMVAFYILRQKYKKLVVVEEVQQERTAESASALKNWTVPQQKVAATKVVPLADKTTEGAGEAKESRADPDSMRSWGSWDGRSLDSDNSQND